MSAPLRRPASEFLASGQVVAGKYRIERMVGSGGMALVFEATHLTLQERVAVKVLADGDNVETRARFLREARAAAKIRSEHVARVFDVGVTPGGASYMVMEYLQGRDFDQLLLERERLGAQEAIDYVLQACEALAEAHAAGVVHRDLKPANLFLTHRADGSACVKVIDFGISKALDVGSGSKNAGHRRAKLDDEDEIFTADSMGSPPYMSPEQLQSTHDVDARSDIWALGCCLYELIAGVAPFAAEPLPKLWQMILDDPPASLRERVPELPSGVEAIVRKCLEKRREDRFQNVAELANALAEFAPESAQLSVSRVSGVMLVGGQPGADAPGAVVIESSPLASSVRIVRRPSGRRSAKGPVLALMALGILVVITAALLVRGPVPSSTPPSSLAVEPAPEPPVAAAPWPASVQPSVGSEPPPSEASPLDRPKAHRTAPTSTRSSREEGLFDDRK